MPNSDPLQSSLILYQTEDGRTPIQCRFDVERLWLTQVQIAELFQTSVPNTNLHLKAICAEHEQTEATTIKSYLIVRTEGARRRSGCPSCPEIPDNWPGIAQHLNPKTSVNGE